MLNSVEYSLNIEVINYVTSITLSFEISNTLNNLYPINPGKSRY